jgi:glycosyltransferase involved in cell wall biosynthesis
MNISIVIATYNRAALLQTTLAELRREAFEPGDEVIVVDNASTDTTPQVIARAARGFPAPLHYLREATPGKTPALNAGIAAARGEVLALTDDDVFLAADWVATLRGVFREPSLALVGGRIDPRWERPAPRWLKVWQDGKYGQISAPLGLLHYGEAQTLGARTVLGANMAIRRSVLSALGGFAPHLGRHRGTLHCGEDHDVCQRAAAAGYRCEYRPELRVEHWVPAERARMLYFLRWFFWSGVTHAVLEEDEGKRLARHARVLRHFLVRRFMMPIVAAVGHSLSGRTSDAAAQMMDAAFAVGYMTQRVGIFRRPASHPKVPHVPPPGRTDAQPQSFGTIG